MPLGETPVPCVRCNQTVKFSDLMALARDLGAEALATGHCVRRVDGPDGPELHRAADLARDQRAGSCSRPRGSSWRMPGSRWAGCRTRRRCAPRRTGSGCRLPTSRTARTSVLSLPATMPRSSPSCAPTRPSRATSWRWTGARSSGTGASRAIPSGSGSAWARLRALTDRSRWSWPSTPPGGGSSSARPAPASAGSCCGR